MKILVAGGAGFIGTHVVVRLVERGHEVHVVDDYSNSTEAALTNVERITGTTVARSVVDLRDRAALDVVFDDVRPEAVIHLAGLKSVSESVADPLRYVDVNLNSTLTLLDAMRAHGVHDLVFSSSATVYGEPEHLPLSETAQTGRGITNPYGRTKYFIEEILRDYVVAQPDARVAVLRYFNPVGAHPSGLIGEDPAQAPNNLAPYITQVAIGRRDRLRVFGDGYPTRDGTGERDYIHVVDLAEGHVAAVEGLRMGLEAVNLGTGEGTTVLELIAAFSTVVGRPIPYEVVAPRVGDVASAYADVSKAAALWGWRAQRTVADACEDAWRWQSTYPQGFRG